MRWLLIVLLVSLGALLFASAGAARHIWLYRAKPKKKGPGAPQPAEESHMEVKHGQ